MLRADIFLYFCPAKKCNNVTTMNFIKRLFVISSLFLASSALPTFAQSEGYFIHTVERGQSLYSISSTYNVPIDEIVALNPGSEKQIRAGESLRIPQKQHSSSNSNHPGGVRYHTIQSGETLYRITQLYNVNAAAICNANPGLSATNFRKGEVIVIPATTEANAVIKNAPEKSEGQENTPASPCREMHKVQRKETIFSISREYGISEKELIAANPELKKGKLKRGSFLCIPHKRKPTGFDNQKQQQQQERIPSNEELFNKNKKGTQSLSTIRAALILPFQLDAPEGAQPLMLEYYEGFLLAVDSLKRQKVNIELHVFDSGSKNQSIATLLKKPELKKMDIIFGPGHSEHIKPLSEFAKSNNIRLVIPFTSKDSEVFNNPLVYQINTPQSYLFSQVHKLFADNFGHYNIVFVEAEDGQNKEEYIRQMKQELSGRDISYRSIPMPATMEELTAVLDSTRQNMIIPTSGTNVTITKLLPIMQMVVRSENNPYELHSFGYPEWQKYTNDHLQAFYEVDTYFYSSFYTNNLLKNSVNFINKFRYWYNEEMMNTYPKYGMLGFDTGYFFLKGLSRYGGNLEANLDRMNLQPVQTGFRFERVNNWGGFINKKVFFIHMTKNHELIKLDFE